MTQIFFPTPPEPGAMEFLPEVKTGWTTEEAYALLTGKMPYVDVIIAAADVHTGAMIAFVPSSNDLAELVLDEEGVEPSDQLHCTALFLGDADEYDEEMRQRVHESIQAFASVQPVISGDVFGYSVWNPDGEACLVADVGGVDLEDAQNALIELCDDLEMGVPDQHVPWRPHITLAYAEDPRTLMTDELMTRTGPMIFDRVRVAFAGVVTDYPLGAVTAAGIFEPFHLAGKHDQATHGRGGLAEHATDGEVRAAQKLNKGKQLDMSDPTERSIGESIYHYTKEPGGPSGIRATLRDPHREGADAHFVRAVAAAPPTAPKLHRGMKDVPAKDLPQEGDVFDIGPTSFTRSEKVSERFSVSGGHSTMTNTRGEQVTVIEGNSVHMTVASGSRALRIDQHSYFNDEQEHVAMGRYRVKSRKEKQVTTKLADGSKGSVTRIEIELEQVSPDQYEITHTTINDRYKISEIDGVGAYGDSGINQDYYGN